MKTICDYLAAEHVRCDQLFAKVETCIGQREWETASGEFCIFEDVMARHIAMEEDILFPAFMDAVHSASAPLTMLRIEHQRLKAIFKLFYNSLQNRDLRGFTLHADSYVLLIQQHSVKEEQMLYPLLDRILAERREHILAAMSAAMHPH